MKQPKLIWQIFPANLFILILTVSCVTWFGSTALKSFYLEELEKDLVARALLVRPLVSEMLEQGDREKLRNYSKNSGREANTRVTVILPDGTVVADSHENPSTMELHHKREEVVAALQGKVGKSLRSSRTLGREMLYVAVPMYTKGRNDAVTAILRMSVAVEAVELALKGISSRILFGVVFFAALAALASLVVSRNISRPLEQIKKAAERFSQGDFSGPMARFPGTSASLEVVTLATAMDSMAAQLNERIGTIKSQRNELETVFASMVESVIAVDSDERVISMNTAAARLLGVERESAKGRVIQEVLRNADLQQQIKEVIKTGVSMENEIGLLDGGGQKFLQTNIVSLYDRKKNSLGALVVMNDVTKLRRLENVRRDFVANVSHELRTPVTSIRGYVETLLDGAIDNRADSIKFLQTVLRQAERLNDIIEDLLVLSRIEQEADHGQIKLETGDLCRVFDVAVETCQKMAEEQGVSILPECSATIQLKMNDTLLEQALVNLLINAIKYSRKGDSVSVVARLEEEAGDTVVKVRITDTGIGIASNHLPRLFERFYRSDKGRGRQHGGTGLGLAIVKHIVLAHNGRVEVASELNVGSTFTITLPHNSDHGKGEDDRSRDRRNEKH